MLNARFHVRKNRNIIIIIIYTISRKDPARDFRIYSPRVYWPPYYTHGGRGVSLGGGGGGGGGARHRGRPWREVKGSRVGTGCVRIILWRGTGKKGKKKKKKNALVLYVMYKKISKYDIRDTMYIYIYIYTLWTDGYTRGRHRARGSPEHNILYRL